MTNHQLEWNCCARSPLNSTIPQITTLKSLQKKNEPRSPQINFNLLAFSRPIQISVSSEILHRRDSLGPRDAKRIMSPRDKANWNLRVKTAALETILEVVEFWFMSVLADLWFCMRNEQLIYTRGSYEIFDSFLKLMHMRSQPVYWSLQRSFNLVNTEKLSWNIYCSLWMQEWRFEFYSTKVAVTRDYYLCIFWIINWHGKRLIWLLI